MTYAQEKKQRDRDRAREADVYRYEPEGLLDLTRPLLGLKTGDLVVKIQPYGCPKNGTMRQCYVATLDGEFIGMRNLASLKLVERRKRRQV